MFCCFPPVIEIEIVAAEEKLKNEDEDSGSVIGEEVEGKKMDEFVGK